MQRSVIHITNTRDRTTTSASKYVIVSSWQSTKTVIANKEHF